MVSGDTREVVVLKNIKSNIIEEAILILKSEPDSKKSSASIEKHGKSKIRDRDFILKEAQDIIEGYIKEHKIERKPLRGSKLKLYLFKRELSLNIIVSAALILGILSLIFIVTKFV